MSRELFELLLVTAASLLNIGLTFYVSSKRVKPEIDKIKAEREESYSEAAESLLASAGMSNDLLKQRVEEMKYDRRAWRRERQDLFNYIAQLKRVIIEAGLHVPVYNPSESDPNIPKIP